MKKALLFTWIIAALGGLFAMLAHSGRPGERGTVAAQWPKESKLVAPKDRPLFVLFIHPECACSVATIRELEKLLPQFENQVEVRIVFKGYDQKLRKPATESRLWQNAKALPGVELILDAKGEETERFGARTSGHAYLYDEKGSLVFNGGLTASRGHEGPASSHSQLGAWLKSRSSSSFFSDIFGCSLFEKKA